MPLAVTIAPETRIVPVNRKLFGTNVTWYNAGDGMTSAGIFRSAMVSAAQEIGLSGLLRYPGGNTADNFDWVQGEGPLGSRGPNTNIHLGTQTTYFGTGEAISLASSLGLSLLLQTDVIHSASRVTSWMAAYPQVLDFEIGNEPYLKEGDPSFWTPPATYLATANSHIAAMLAANPNVRIAVPIAPDTIGPIPGVHYTGYNNTILAGLDPRIRRFSMHLYIPDGSIPISDRDLWACGMASYRTIEQYIADGKADLAAHGFSGYEIIPTEYGSLFQYNPTKLSSVFSAIMYSQLISILAKDPVITNAMQFALADHGGRGLIEASDGRKRPAFYVFQKWITFMQGYLVGSSVSGAQMLSNIQYSRVFAANDTPSMDCIASASGSVVRVILNHKIYEGSDSVSLRIPGKEWRCREMKCLRAAPGYGPIDASDTPSNFLFTDLPFTQTTGDTFTFTAPGASFIYAEFTEATPMAISGEYGRLTSRKASPFSAATSAVAFTLVPADYKRTGMEITVTGPADLFLGDGFDPTPTSYSHVIPAFTYWYKEGVYQGIIRAVSSYADGTTITGSTEVPA